LQRQRIGSAIQPRREDYRCANGEGKQQETADMRSRSTVADARLEAGNEARA
jgi:hypothetical protein